MDNIKKYHGKKIFNNKYFKKFPKSLKIVNKNKFLFVVS